MVGGIARNPNGNDIARDNKHTMNKDHKKYAIELLFAVALTVITVKVQRAASTPDFGRTFAMGRAWSVKRFANKQVDIWQGIADKAATTYNSLKP
jgi:hypothetical protein